MKTGRLSTALAVVAAGLASTVASLATFSPGPSFSVGIPSSSSLSSSATGPLYFQISAPTSYQWAAFGIGQQMRGATIFVIYPNGSGNVTISARLGNQGHVEPKQDATLQAGVTLLAGSGIVNGQMVANVKCTTCKLDSSATKSSGPFIGAWAIGTAFNDASTTHRLFQHASDNTAQFALDLTTAAITRDANPFLSTSGTTTTTSSSPGSRPTAAPGGGARVIGPSIKTIKTYQKAHGIIMGVTMVLLFPLGAIFMRLGGNAKIHGAIQVLSIFALIAGFVLGIKLGQFTHLLYQGLGTTHTIFGTVIIGLFIIQPFLGIWHHLQYKRTQSRVAVSHLHIWYGRIIMLLGIVNGGLGLKLAGNSKNGEIAYGVVAGVVGLAYIGLVIIKRKSKKAGSFRQKETVPSVDAGTPPRAYAYT